MSFGTSKSSRVRALAGQAIIMLIWTLILASSALAEPLRPTFTSCLNSYPPVAPESARLNVTDVLASIVSNQEAAREGLQGNGVQVLRINLLGQTASELQGYNNDTNKLATLFIDSKAASFNVYTSTSWVCNSLFPPDASETTSAETTYCPLPAGPFGLNVSIPLYRSYALTTIRTQIRIVDTSETANTLSCIELQLTPYQKGGWYYGFFLWFPVALAIGFFVTTWGARFAAGWVVGSGVAEYEQKETALSRGSKLVHGKKEARMRKWGTMIISGLSGERLSVSGGLLRFITPGLKDILHHIQFCTILGMIAVLWPKFAYPILAQGAWADLVWNTTLVQSTDQRVNPYPDNYTASPDFDSQITNQDLPLYLDESAFNPLLDLYDRPTGIESWAFAVGLRPQDLFGTCLAIFMILAAGIILISLLLWSLHCLLEYASPAPSARDQTSGRPSLGPTPKPSYGTKDTYEARTPSLWDTSAPPALPAQHSIPERIGPSHARRIWWRFRPKGEAGAFHACALYGNLLRLILIFHLPVTVFSIYQLVLGSRASVVSRVFAALAFAFISALIPAGVMWKINRTPTGKLYDATRTLLSLGPMYNVYVEEKQMFRAVPLGASLITGIVVGAGQASGLAQAIILVLVELATLVAPAVWYPWDEGASMGAPHTFIAAVRTISMVLVMLLSRELGMSVFTDQWLAYAILLLQAIVFVFFLLVLLIKAVEGFIRLFGGVHFDESTHPLDGGLFGAIADLDCLNPKGGKAAERKRRKRGSKQLQRNVSAVGSLTTQMMLDRHSLGVMRPTTTPYTTELERDTPPSSYFPALTPPLGPPPMGRRSSDDQPYGGGFIMDAWRPTPGPESRSYQGGYQSDQYQPAGTGQGYPSQSPGHQAYASSNPINSAHGRSQSSPMALAPPLANVGGAYPNTGFSVIRGGRSDVQNPYSVRAGTGAERAATISPPPTMRVSQVSPKPTHSRQQSSSAIIEDYDTRTSPPISPLYPPQSQMHMQMGRSGGGGGIKPNNHGLAPPVLAIPKRRSLNNLKDDSSTLESQDENDAKKKKRRSWFKSGDLPRPEDYDDTEESDDEPGPRRKSKGKSKARGSNSNVLPYREPVPFEPIPLVVDYRDDDEAGASRPRTRPTPSSPSRPGWRGMLGMGPKKKKSLDDMAELARDENKARKAALAAESGAMLAGVQPTPSEGRSFKVARRGPTSSPSVPGPSTSASAAGTGEPRSFKVKRAKQPNTPTQVGMGYHDIPLVSPPSPATPTEVRSFKVHRQGQSQSRGTSTPADIETSSPSSSFVVNRPKAAARSTPPQSPLLSPDPHSSPQAKGKASMFQSGGR